VLNGAIILAVVLLGTSLVQRYYVTKQRAAQMISVPGIEFSKSDKTLLLFLQQDCGVCLDSLPFYRKIIATFKEPSRVQFVLITPGKPELAHEFFQKENLSFAIVLQGKKGLLGVVGSPTLILADSNGLVHGSWSGQLSPQQENDVWTMLTN
jgi:peroxiredoxin